MPRRLVASAASAFVITLVGGPGAPPSNAAPATCPSLPSVASGARPGPDLLRQDLQDFGIYVPDAVVDGTPAGPTLYLHSLDRFHWGYSPTGGSLPATGRNSYAGAAALCVVAGLMLRQARRMSEVHASR